MVDFIEKLVKRGFTPLEAYGLVRKLAIIDELEQWARTTPPMEAEEEQGWQSAKGRVLQISQRSQTPEDAAEAIRQIIDMVPHPQTARDRGRLRGLNEALDAMSKGTYDNSTQFMEQAPPGGTTPIPGHNPVPRQDTSDAWSPGAGSQIPRDYSIGPGRMAQLSLNSSFSKEDNEIYHKNLEFRNASDEEILNLLSSSLPSENSYAKYLGDKDNDFYWIPPGGEVIGDYAEYPSHLHVIRALRNSGFNFDAETFKGGYHYPGKGMEVVTGRMAKKSSRDETIFLITPEGHTYTREGNESRSNHSLLASDFIFDNTSRDRSIAGIIDDDIIYGFPYPGVYREEWFTDEQIISLIELSREYNIDKLDIGTSDLKHLQGNIEMLIDFSLNPISEEDNLEEWYEFHLSYPDNPFYNYLLNSYKEDFNLNSLASYFLNPPQTPPTGSGNTIHLFSGMSRTASLDEDQLLSSQELNLSKNQPIQGIVNRFVATTNGVYYWNYSGPYHNEFFEIWELCGGEEDDVTYYGMANLSNKPFKDIAWDYRRPIRPGEWRAVDAIASEEAFELPENINQQLGIKTSSYGDPNPRPELGVSFNRKTFEYEPWVFDGPLEGGDCKFWIDSEGNQYWWRVVNMRPQHMELVFAIEKKGLPIELVIAGEWSDQRDSNGVEGSRGYPVLHTLDEKDEREMDLVRDAFSDWGAVVNWNRWLPLDGSEESEDLEKTADYYNSPRPVAVYILGPEGERIESDDLYHDSSARDLTNEGGTTDGFLSITITGRWNMYIMARVEWDFENRDERGRPNRKIVTNEITAAQAQSLIEEIESWKRDDGSYIIKTVDINLPDLDIDDLSPEEAIQWLGGITKTAQDITSVPPTFDMRSLFDLKKYVDLKGELINWDAFRVSSKSPDDDIQSLLEVLTEVGVAETADPNRIGGMFNINREKLNDVLQTDRKGNGRDD